MKKKSVIFICCVFVFSLVIVISQKEKSPEYVFAQASWPKCYSEIEDLAYDSDIISVVEVKEINRTYYVNGKIPFTEFNVKVTVPIRGVEQDEVFIITQTGINNENFIFQIEDDPLLQIDKSYLIFGYNNEVGTVTILSGPQGRFVYNEGKVTSLLLSQEFNNNSTKSDFLQKDKYSDRDFVYLDNVSINTVMEKIRNKS